MKTVRALIIINIVLHCMPSYAQNSNMNKEVESMILLGKDAIVQLALDLMNESISVANFSKIKVMTDDRTVYVSFRNPIKYLPLKSVFYFDIGVDFPTKAMSYTPVSNGLFQPQEKIPFYKETKESKMNMLFVIQAINKSSEIGSIDIVTFEDEMIIREAEDHYSVTIVSEYQESSCKVQKKSGKVYDFEHAHLVPPPFETQKSKFREIN